MKDHELAIRYGKTGMWLYDIPIHQPNFWCSRCKQQLDSLETISFIIERDDSTPLEFEYHKECITEALNGLKKLPEPNKTLLKTE